MEAKRMTIKEKIEYLISHGVKIIELANRVNCSQTTLGRWLRGETKISSRLEKDLELMIQQFIAELENILAKPLSVKLNDGLIIIMKLIIKRVMIIILF